MNNSSILSRSYRFLLAITWLFFIGSNAALAQQNGLTPLQIAKLQHIEEVVISPDGKTIAYTISKPANPLKKNIPPAHHLYIRGANDSVGTAVVTSVDVSHIAFRPNHKSITFLAKRPSSHHNALFQVSTKGGNAKKLFNFNSVILGYSWAPDGNHLAFMAKESSQIKKGPLLPYYPKVYHENMHQRRGYVTNVASENGGLHQFEMEGSIYSMQWAPNGKALAITIAPTPLVDDYYMKRQVWITDRRGTKVLARVNHKGKLKQIAWSPDGSHLAMLAGANIHDPAAGRLFVVSKTGGKPAKLRPHYKGAFEQIQWVDSTSIAYLASTGVWSTYGLISADGAHIDTLIAPGQAIMKEFSRAQNGTTAFLVEQPTHPQELYLMKPQKKVAKRLTYSNPWLQKVTLGKQKVVSWHAQDSLKLQGILIYPTNYQQEQRYPLITVAHGGPESHFSNGWLTNYALPGQLAAGRGYFVFYPNYRGSTGRGHAFATSSQGDPAGAEFDDILAGINQLINVGIIDSSKVGVTGGSYGGYATAWLSTRYTDQFAAGVMFVGISNMISKWGTTDIPNELYLVHNRVHVWEDWKFWLKRSPIYYAGQADTPLLILAGMEDNRVDPGQSHELYRHIETRTDTPVRLVLYPGEGHGNDSATARYDYNRRMMRWFDHYLKGEGLQKIPPPNLDFTKIRKRG